MNVSIYSARKAIEAICGGKVYELTISSTGKNWAWIEAETEDGRMGFRIDKEYRIVSTKVGSVFYKKLKEGIASLHYMEMPSPQVIQDFINTQVKPQEAFLSDETWIDLFRDYLLANQIVEVQE